MINTISAATAISKLDALQETREAWETGIFKKSTEELYAILDRCLGVFQEVSAATKGKRKLIYAIDEALKTRGFAARANTSLQTKIVRYVFGDCGKRAFTYARVIVVAATEKPETQTLAAFITERGGIEQIRKTPKNGGPSPKERRERLIENGEQRFATAEPILAGIELIADLQPANNNGVKMMAVLMRKDDDGTGSLVFRSNSQAIINALLAAAERDAIARYSEADERAAPGIAATQRAIAIDRAVAA